MQDPNLDHSEPGEPSPSPGLTYEDMWADLTGYVTVLAGKAGDSVAMQIWRYMQELEDRRHRPLRDRLDRLAAEQET